MNGYSFLYMMTPWKGRLFLNFYPPYLFSGVRVTYIAPDWKKVVVKVKKSFLNKNYVGTIFGGTLQAAADPHYMMMLIQILGIKKYVIWDQAGSIEYKKPARSAITFTFTLTDEQINKIKEELAVHRKIRPEFEIEGIDEKGEVCVLVKRVIYLRLK